LTHTVLQRLQIHVAGNVWWSYPFRDAGTDWMTVSSRGAPRGSRMDGLERGEFVSKEMHSDGTFLEKMIYALSKERPKTCPYEMLLAFFPWLQQLKKLR
jgi:hypothetical protein